MGLLRPFKYTLFAFYVANIYSFRISAILFYVKFAFLIFLLLATFSYGRRYGRAVPGVAIGCIALALVVSVFTVASDYSTTKSVMRLAAMGIVLVTSMQLAAAWGDNTGHRYTASAFLSVTKFAAWSAVICLVLGINLGRGGGRFSAWTDNPNTLGMMIFIMVPVVLHKALVDRQKGWRSEWILLGAMLLVLALTGSRAALVAAIFGAVVLLWAHGRMHGGIIALTAVALLVFALAWDTMAEAVEDVPGLNRLIVREMQTDVTGPEAQYGSGREQIWPLAWDEFKTRPWIGHGFGTEEAVVEPLKVWAPGYQGSNVHNSYLSALLQVGLLGTLAFLFFFFFAGAHGVRVVRAVRTERPSMNQLVSVFVAMFFASLVHGFFESWLFSTGNVLSMVFWPTAFLILRATAPAVRRTAAPRTRSPAPVRTEAAG